MKKYLTLMGLQLAACFTLSAAAFVLRPVSWLYKLSLWGVLPLAGGVSAFLLTEKGINPYAAWIMPPLSLLVARLLLSMGAFPDGAWFLLTAFTGIVGAAAGDVYNKTKRRGRKSNK